jgi:hypothetical protein
MLTVIHVSANIAVAIAVDLFVAEVFKFSLKLSLALLMSALSSKFPKAANLFEICT